MTSKAEEIVLYTEQGLADAQLRGSLAETTSV